MIPYIFDSFRFEEGDPAVKSSERLALQAYSNLVTQLAMRRFKRKRNYFISRKTTGASFTSGTRCSTRM